MKRMVTTSIFWLTELTLASRIAKLAILAIFFSSHPWQSLGAIQPNNNSLPLLKTISQIHQLSEANCTVACAVHIQGTVLWIAPSREQFIMQDVSGGIRVKLDPYSHPRLKLGQNILIEGNVFYKANTICDVLLNNQGSHAPIEKSASIHLNRGMHPIQLDCLNALGGGDLHVSYQGPGKISNPIPDSALFHVAEIKNGVTNFTHGVISTSYTYKRTRKDIPSFENNPAARFMIVSNFYLPNRYRNTNMNIRFHGYIHIPKSGLYTFWLNGDGGSKLIINHASVNVTILSQGQLPLAQEIYANQPLPPYQEYKWSKIDGRVTFVTDRPKFLELEIHTSTGVIYARVAKANKAYSRLLLNSTVQVFGVAKSTYSSDGKIIDGVLLVPNIKQIKTLKPATDVWNIFPLKNIASLKRLKPMNTFGSVAHFYATVRSIISKNSFLVDDASGQILVETAIHHLKPGSNVEILGHKMQFGTNVVLNWAFYRKKPNLKLKATNPLPLLTSIEKIKSLSLKKAKLGYSANIRGIITAPFSTGFFIQKGKWAIYVRTQGITLPARPHSGDYWEVKGTTYAAFAPNIQAKQLVRLGSGIMPNPIKPTPEQLINGSLDTRYIELQGVVTDTGVNYLDMLTSEGQIHVQVSDIDPTFGETNSKDLKKYENASIRVRGCAIPWRNGNTQHIQAGKPWIWLCNYSITIDKQPIDNIFSLPSESISDIRLFNPKSSILNEVKVSGQIIHKQGNHYFLWDGTNGLQFILKRQNHLKIGDIVEVAGFPDFHQPSVILHESVAKRIGHAMLPKPRSIMSEHLIDRNFDDSLVKTEALLTDINIQSSEYTLTLQSGTHGFVAKLNAHQGLLRNLLPGSRVMLSGVYVSQGANATGQGTPTSFKLLLNSPNDITVLKHPDWWTLQRLLIALGTMLLILAGALLWIFTLRRQVSAQALLIRKKAEREIALEERSRIARDIHDTLEQALVGASLQLNALASSLHSCSKEPLKILKVARAMINHAQVEVKKTVHNLRFLNAQRNNLPAALFQFTTNFEGNKQITITFNMEGIYRQLPSQIENHILRIGQEAVTNAVKHSAAKSIIIQLSYENSRIGLSIVDDGNGFDLATVRGLSSGHFGLLGMHERAEKIGGNLSIKSNIGRGTTISIEINLPARN